MRLTNCGRKTTNFIQIQTERIESLFYFVSFSFMEFFFSRAALLSIEIVVAATKTTTGNIKHHIFMNSLQTLRIYHPYTVITHTHKIQKNIARANQTHTARSTICLVCMRHARLFPMFTNTKKKRDRHWSTYDVKCGWARKKIVF